MTEQTTNNLEHLRFHYFLLWLDKFLGEWQLDDERYQVRRRPDGWLMALRFGFFGHVPLGPVLSNGRLIERPPSLLGPYPLELSQPLMKLWLTSEQFESLRGAWHVSSGRRMIVEALEQRARELPLIECQARLMAMWSAEHPWQEPLPPDDLRTHEELLEQFRQSR